eukprot:g5666.t2
MSTRKGAGATRTRKPKHQNTFAFRHNPKSQKTAKILSSVNAGLCPSCHDKVEWRKRYRKYKPLRQPATCNDCHKKTITAAYHKICATCARERRVCPWCCTKGRPRETPEDGGDGDDSDEEEGMEEPDEVEEVDEEEEVDEDGKGKASVDGDDSDEGEGMEEPDEVEGVEEKEVGEDGRGKASVDGDDSDEREGAEEPDEVEGVEEREVGEDGKGKASVDNDSMQQDQQEEEDGEEEGEEEEQAGAGPAAVAGGGKSVGFASIARRSDSPGAPPAAAGSGASDVLRWSLAVDTMVQIPKCIGGAILTIRMWIYTRSRGSKPHGNGGSCLVALGGVTLGVVTMVVFVIFGRVLVKAIDKSLQHQDQQQLQATRTAAGGVQGKNGGAGNHSLLDARRKVKTVVVVDVVLVSSGTLITLFAMIKGFDVEAPLVMFGITFANVDVNIMVRVSNTAPGMVKRKK